MSTSEYIINVSEASFQKDVIERSKQVPVMVDFWAAWCGPCRMLGPILERVTNESDGALILAKLDVDQNPRLAQQYDVRGIPAVKIFRGGRVVEQFVGAQPEAEVRRIVKTFAPSEVDRRLMEAQSLVYGQRWEEAEKAYHNILAAKPDYAPAAIELGRMYLKLGRGADAQSMFEQVSSNAVEHKIAEALLPLASLMSMSPNGAEREVDTLYDAAAQAAREQRVNDALDTLLDVLRKDRHYRDGAAKRAMLALLEYAEDPALSHAYRRKLANVLF
jgi:putative thioredoxin